MFPPCGTPRGSAALERAVEGALRVWNSLFESAEPDPGAQWRGALEFGALAAACKDHRLEWRTGLRSAICGHAREPPETHRHRRRKDQFQGHRRETPVRSHRCFRRHRTSCRGALAIALGSATLAERRRIAIRRYRDRARRCCGNLGAIAARRNPRALGSRVARRSFTFVSRPGLWRTRSFRFGCDREERRVRRQGLSPWATRRLVV